MLFEEPDRLSILTGSGFLLFRHSFIRKCGLLKRKAEIEMPAER